MSNKDSQKPTLPSSEFPNESPEQQAKQPSQSKETDQIAKTLTTETPEQPIQYTSSLSENVWTINALQFYGRNYKKWSWEFICKIREEIGTGLLSWYPQKYVLRAEVIDSENINFYLATDYEAENHRDISWWRWNIVWWWCIMRKEGSKEIFIFDKSIEFWPVKEKLFPVVTDILEKEFPWYQIKFWDPY